MREKQSFMRGMREYMRAPRLVMRATKGYQEGSESSGKFGLGKYDRSSGLSDCGKCVLAAPDGKKARSVVAIHP